MSASGRMRFVLVPCALLIANSTPARADLGVAISAVQPLNANAATDIGDDFRVSLATDRSGHWVATWATEFVDGSSIDNDGDILVARSIDNGQNWSNPIPLNTDAAVDLRFDGSPRIATDGQGHWVAVWEAADLFQDFEIMVARSGDNGASWTAPVRLNTNVGDSAADHNPQVAADGQGHWVAVWSSSGFAGTDSDLLFARSVDNGANWSFPAPLNTNALGDAGFDQAPSIATDGHGDWVVVWESANRANGTMGEDNDIWVARSVDNGANWSVAAQLDPNADVDNRYDSEPSLVTDGAGHWLTVWQSEEDGSHEDEIFLARSLDNGASWTTPATMIADATTDGASDVSPTIAADSLGDWVAIWNSSGATGQSVRVARSIDNGANWSAPGPLFNAGGGFPDLVTDGRGNWLAAWESDGDFDGTDTDLDILTARFALPDCNDNLIGDPLETALFLAPDLNFNNVPDVCELPFALPPTVQPAGCGGGMCGVGAAAIAPLCIVGVSALRRSLRR